MVFLNQFFQYLGPGCACPYPLGLDLLPKLLVFYEVSRIFHRKYHGAGGIALRRRGLALLSPSLTASWEKGLSMVSEGALSADEYMKKLSDFIKKNVNGVKEKHNSLEMLKFYEYDKTFYGKEKAEKEKDVKEEN